MSHKNDTTKLDSKFLDKVRAIAHQNFIDNSSLGLDGDQFTTACYLEAVLFALSAQGISFDIEYEYKSRQRRKN